MKYRILTIFLILIASFSCNDNEELGILTPEAAKTLIAEEAQAIHNDIVGIVQTEGAEALTDLMDLTDLADPFNGRSSLNRSETNKLLKEKFLQFKSIFIPKGSVNLRTDEHDGFDFEANWGSYEWLPMEEDFIKTSSEGEMIIIRFPTEGSPTNNAELRITGYNES